MSWAISRNPSVTTVGAGTSTCTSVSDPRTSENRTFTGNALSRSAFCGKCEMFGPHTEDQLLSLGIRVPRGAVKQLVMATRRSSPSPYTR